MRHWKKNGVEHLLPVILKKTFVIILTLIGFITFGQENKLDRIDYEVNIIETVSTLTETEFDLSVLTGITTNGGGIKTKSVKS